MKKRFVALLLVLIMVLGLLPVSAFAADDGVDTHASNSTVVLHPSVNNTVTGVKVRVGDKIDGHPVKSISGYDITVDLGKYNVNNDTFRLPYAKDIWEGVDNNKVDYISWAGSGSNRRSEGASAVLANGKNTAYYYFKGEPVLPTFTLNYDANGGTGAPASQTYKATSEYEKSHTFTISTQVPTREGYTFLGWSTNRNATTAERQPGGSIVVTGTTTLYAVWEENTPPTPDIPEPTVENIDAALRVKVVCTTPKSGHDSAFYELLADSFTRSEIDKSGAYPTCSITISPELYIKVYSTLLDCQHTTDDQPKTVELFWNKETRKWAVRDGQSDVIFNAVCGAESEIPGDQKPEFEKENAKIRVQCVEYPSKHDPYTKTYRILPDSYTDLGWDRTEYGYIYSIRLNRAKYIAQFDQEIGRAHTDTEPNKETRIEWRWENGAWHLIDGPDGVTADIKVKCAETPAEPKKPTALVGSFAIVCKNNEATHAYKADYIATPSQYTISDVQKDEQGYYVTATVKVAPNLAEYNARTGAEHRLVNEQDATLTITFRYNTEVTGDENRKWMQQGDMPVVEVKCAEKFPVHVVIFRNGDTSKAYKDIALESQPKGHVINLNELDIGKYYKPNYTGTYDFYGWYDDGGFNDYLKAVAAGKDAPAGLKEITVNGWTNIKCMVYDYEKVVYFNTEEDRAAYQADHSLTHLILKSTTARHGDPLPTPDAPTATREGHTFKWWSREGQTVDVTGQTVNGWTNLVGVWKINEYTVSFDANGGKPTPGTQTVEYNKYATEPTTEPTKDGYNFEYWYLDKEDTKFVFETTPITDNITLKAKWSVAPHNIYAYTRVNTAFGPLTKPEFYEDPNFKLSETDRSRLGLGAYNTKGYFSVVAFNFDKMALTEDEYFGADAELAAVVAALKDEKNNDALEVAKETADKIDWKGLYKADDSEGSDYGYKSGYPTEDKDGYQLAGNLYLMAVMYDTNAEGDEVKDMPAVKYIYDGVYEIYDFEFPGTTIQLPTPKRLGYTFKGWSVEVIGGDNEIDTDRYDMTGADDGDAEETLYKGSYDSSETAGILKFTAKWEEVKMPTDEELKDLEEVVLVKCIADETQSHRRAYSLLGDLNDEDNDNEGYFVNTLTIDKEAGEVRFDISFIAEPYVAKFNEELPNHVRTDAKLVPITMVWDDADECWRVKTQGIIEVTEEHTVTFVPNNGEENTTERVIHGEKVAQPNPAPEKTGFTFKGWYLGDAEYDFNTPVTSDITLTAEWERNNYSYLIEYYRQVETKDGSVAYVLHETETVPNAPFGTTVTINLADAKYQNRYIAEHYYVDASNVNNVLTGVVGADNKTPVLKVYYNLDFHTLTFDTMGGSKVAPERVRHGLTVAKPRDPVNAGYIFDGWYTDKTFRYRYNFATPLTEDITIYAKWVWMVLPGTTVKKNTPKLNTADHFAYVQGYPDGTVKPTGNITRAETAAILFRLMDDSTRNTYYSTRSGFRDVALGSWYNTYVATLNNAGVITDSANGNFRPNEAITRAELAAMLANFTDTAGAANYFNDVSAKYWAANAIAICAKLGWINGYPDGSFRPDRNVTRAELMAMINRATGRAPKSADAFLPGMKTWSDNTADKWYYLDVQEATNSHTYTVKGSEKWTALNAAPNWSKYE